MQICCSLQLDHLFRRRLGIQLQLLCERLEGSKISLKLDVALISCN
jgi:hypothetical protein